ncbi:alpha/beta fold hydrolase [Nocardia bovistercoris]|uniref:Alpha/beta fold hydrolase n=1 Tax=Nocardia bovistercoris TaxID=2785916 RepID=A0A931I855_9NOCA|nr:alpha/beta fold hydrolase [Nocardia bovistercoris]MBH0775517.1 alpha/beta fold hydrolase [Nocardia bovistercoris]
MSRRATPPTRFVDVPWGRLAYTEHGVGTDVVVLLHQFLLDKRVQWPVAEYLAEQGYRVLCVDLPGHGESAAPHRPDAYGLSKSAAAVIDLLDALGLDKVFLGGASFGSLNALRIGLVAPHRLHGLLLEMPILDRGIRAACYWGGPGLGLYTLLGPLLRRLVPLARRPARRPDYLGLALSLIARDPIATRHMGVGLLGHGLEPWIADWRSLRLPTLVIGHPHDPVHLLADAEQLHRELDDVEYLYVPSFFALRRRPETFLPQVARFVDRCCPPRAADLAS